MANTLTFANLTLTDANIFGGINYIADLNTGDEFSIGNTASASVTFVTDTQLPLYTKDSTNGTFTWTRDNVSRGRFYITEVTKTGGMYEVTAYDAMILLETSIEALSLTFPLTVAAAASAVATFINCTTSGTINNSTMAAADGTIDDTTTCRQLLGWVAEASGCSVKIDGADHICFMYYAASGITVSASDYVENGLDVADYTCAAIDNVTICDAAGMTSATAGSGTNSLFVVGNPFLYEATNTEAAVILGCVDSFVYAPFTCEMFEENGLEIGVTATFGSTTSLVMHIESSEDGATASAVGSDSRAEFNKDLDILVNEALATATATGQYFWHTQTDTGAGAGAHVTQIPKETFLNSPSNGGGNVLIDTGGLNVRDGLDVLAMFSGSTARVGKDSDKHVTIDSQGLKIYKGSESSANLVASFGSDVTLQRGNRYVSIDSRGINLSGTIYAEGNIEAGGNIDLGDSGRIYMPNNYAIHATHALSDTTAPMIYVSSSDNLVLGSEEWNDCYVHRVYTPGSGTSSLVPNVRITDAHQLKRTTHSNSSARFKHDIKDIENKELDPHRLYDIEVKQFRYNDDVITDPKDCRYDKDLVGFIAEQVRECYPIAVDINENGECEAWSPQYIVPPMLALLQEQHKEIELLKQKIKKLEEKDGE